MAVKFNPFTGNLDLIDTTAAAGSTTQVQYNNAGLLAGSADLTWDDTGKELAIGGDINLDDGGTYTTTLQTVTPTANRTISFPDATGTLALVAGSNGQVLYNSSGANAGLATVTTDGTDVTLTGRFISSLNGAASAPPGTFTGTWFTGGTSTTTKPQVLIEPTGTTSTAWNTSGTGLGVNAASGFTGNLYDLQLNGTSKYAFGVGALTFGDAVDLAFNTTTGTKIGTATTQKLAFWNAAPVVQPAAVADITTTATSGSLPTPDGSVTIADATTPTVAELLEYCVELEAKLEAALGHLRTLGLIAT
jgi:YD repeat-containing protein